MIALAVLLASPAAAQQRRRAAAPRPVPDRGMNAVGVQIGAGMPADVALKNGIDLTGTLEHYFSQRVSFRGAVSGAWFDIFGHSFDGTVSPVALDGNVANNNGGFGIVAVPGVIDGGGNRAAGNGNPLQCTNVFCN